MVEPDRLLLIEKATVDPVRSERGVRGDYGHVTADGSRRQQDVNDILLITLHV